VIFTFSTTGVRRLSISGQNIFYIEEWECVRPKYEGWNFNSGNYLFTNYTK